MAMTTAVSTPPTSAMGDAGNRSSARAMPTVRRHAQGKAIDALRKGMQDLADALGGQQNGEGRDPGDGDGPGQAVGRQQSGGERTDPLGRPLRGKEYSDDYTVKIPGEIDAQRARRILEELRRRLSDPARPQIEARLPRASAEGFLTSPLSGPV